MAAVKAKTINSNRRQRNITVLLSFWLDFEYWEETAKKIIEDSKNKMKMGTTDQFPYIKGTAVQKRKNITETIKLISFKSSKFFSAISSLSVRK